MSTLLLECHARSAHAFAYKYGTVVVCDVMYGWMRDKDYSSYTRVDVRVVAKGPKRFRLYAMGT